MFKKRKKVTKIKNVKKVFFTSMAQTNETFTSYAANYATYTVSQNQPTLTWHAITLRSANRIGQFLADISPKE